MDTERKGVILVDVLSGAEGEFDRSFLERSGHPVLMCEGPAKGTICPILAGKSCDLFEDAHGIVFDLDLDVPEHREILQRYRQLARPDLPIRAVLRPGQKEKYADLLHEVEVWVDEPNVASLDGFAAEVEAADRFAEVSEEMPES